MPFIALLRHHIGYKLHREEIKNLVTNDNLTSAQNILQAKIQESDTFVTTVASDDNTAILDNLSLHHAKDHLDAFQNSNQIQQKNATTTALGESD